MSRPPRLWHRPIVYRSAIGLYVFVVLAVAGISFAVSSIDVQGSLYVRAQPDLERDRVHGMRGVFHYAPTGEMLVPDEMEWWLEEDRDGQAEKFPIEFVDGPPQKTWPTATFRIGDEVPDGDYILRVDAAHRQVSTLSAGYRVTVSGRPEPATRVADLDWPRQMVREDDPSRRPPTVEVLVDDSDQPLEASQAQATDEETDPPPADIALAVIPDDGELMRGMEQTIYFRVYDPESGQPIAATLDVELVDGLLETSPETSLRTNRLGFGHLELKPATTPTLEITVEPAPSHRFDGGHDDADRRPPKPRKFKVTLPSVATQFSLSPTSPVVLPGETIEAAAYSVLSDGYFMVDLYDQQGQRLLDTLSLLMSDGRSGVQFKAPNRGESSSLLRLQTYQSIYGTNHGWDTAYIMVVEDDSEQALREAATDLFRWIADSSASVHHEAILADNRLDDMSRSQLIQLMRAGLAEVPRTFELPSVVLNTREEDRRQLDSWRADVQDDLRWMMGFVLIIGIIVALYFVVAGIRRNMRETHTLRQFDIEATDPPDEAQRRAARIERLAVTLQGIIVFCTLLVFALGILIMVSYL